MVRNVLSSVLLWTAVTNALPATTNEPSRTIEERDSLTDNIFAAAVMRHSQNQPFGTEQKGSCDLKSANLPMLPGLPSPSGTLAFVTVGRGTQNYTCDPAHPTATPTAVGALANLYDASCIAGSYPFLSSIMPSIALQFPKPSVGSNDMLVSMSLLGHHYFTDSKSPVFNLDTANGNAGYVNVASDSKVSAPSGAPMGQNGKGFGAVQWLALNQKPGPQGPNGQQSFKNVYRVNTAGGQPPSTCENMPEAFEVQYAAEYWFFK